jgi:asparagine synthase (glutamine-hydrolysing)
MSVQFGRWNFDGEPAGEEYLTKARALFGPYGPEARGSYCKEGLSILHHAFHTTEESRRQIQPYVSASGMVTTWDGRLDNRAELIEALRGRVTGDASDVAIVEASYEQWGLRCLPNLIGDWAVSIWNPAEHSLVLAKDPMGSRHLNYYLENKRITWSTVLEPLVLLANDSFVVNEEYVAGWLSFFPATHLTPYVGIHSVPPSCWVLVRPETVMIHKYWDFDPSKKLRYRTDGEYEEHFRVVFAQSVHRRLRSDAPILAELSGGIDSSAIVCMADSLIGHGRETTPRLDTLSFFCNSEPNWDERPYFAKVEEKRGRIGHHIELGPEGSAEFEFESERFAATPGSGGHHTDAARDFNDIVVSQGNRVVLSGTGGDEVLGGVPIASPELADLLTQIRIATLARQLKAWALSKRKPWFHLLLETASKFLPFSLIGPPQHLRPARWLQPDFVRRNRLALIGYESRWRLFGPQPTFQENLSTLDYLRRQLACCPLPSHPIFEVRHPYLDRSLLEFLFAIPREQLIRPGQRRSLMRRALAGIVPSEILSRRRKAYMTHRPLASICASWSLVEDLLHSSACAARGWIDGNKLWEAMNAAKRGEQAPLVLLLRTLTLEAWTRSLTGWGLPTSGRSHGVRSREPTPFHQRAQANETQTRFSPTG